MGREKLRIIISILPVIFFGLEIYPGQIITLRGIGRNIAGKNFQIISDASTTTVKIASLPDFDKKILNLKNRPLLSITGLIERKNGRYYIVPASKKDIKVVSPSTKVKEKMKDGKLKTNMGKLGNYSRLDFPQMPDEIYLPPQTSLTKIKKWLLILSGLEATVSIIVYIKYKKSWA